MWKIFFLHKTLGEFSDHLWWLNLHKRAVLDGFWWLFWYLHSKRSKSTQFVSACGFFMICRFATVFRKLWSLLLFFSSFSLDKRYILTVYLFITHILTFLYESIMMPKENWMKPLEFVGSYGSVIIWKDIQFCKLQIHNDKTTYSFA